MISRTVKGSAASLCQSEDGMRKTGRWKVRRLRSKKHEVFFRGLRFSANLFSWIMIVVLVLGLTVPVSLSRLYHTEVRAQSSGNEDDGVYTIEGRLWHATMDQPSMGNSAVTQPMKIVKSGDSVALQMEFHSLNSGVFSGYLYSMHYFPSWDREDNMPNEAEPVSVTVTEYYDSIYDEYNHPSAGLDREIKGKLYPHYAVMPVQWGAASTWVQVYVPVMEAISAGSGRQYARLQLDWSTLQKTEENVGDISTVPAEGGSSGSVAAPASKATPIPDKTAPTGMKSSGGTSGSGTGSSKGNKKLKIGSLEDGTYTITGEMLKPDRKTKSMSNEALDHNITLTVKKGKYSLTVNFSGLIVGSSKGYLSKLKYFKTGYKIDKNGVLTGNKAAVTIKAYQKNSSGRKLSDTYGTDYPAKVTFPMITEAKKDGYVPLQVFVPIMDAISAGTGTQPVYLKLDLNSIKAGKSSTKSNSASSTSKKTSGKTSSGKKSNSGSSQAKATANTSSDIEKGTKGTIYSCQMISSYKHPVTGMVEDSGGESSFATGQGMAESVLGSSGMVEKTEDGAYYLTLRMSLIDLTSDHEFWVQKRGDSGWKSVSAAVTQTGSDQNGKTSDFCLSIPDKDSIVKTSMYVEPMGRNVVFYAYPKNLKKGQPADMKATKVTASAAKVSSSIKDEEEIEEDEGELAETAGETEDISSLSGAGLSRAQGLSLSTTGADISSGDDLNPSEKESSGREEMSFGKWILVLVLSITFSGLLLMAAGAGLVYYFRRNWHRWGEEMIDDDE